MSTEKEMTPENAEGALPLADTGNASNPFTHRETAGPEGNQLLGKKAEKYLREAGNIEDLPDAEEEEEMDKTTEDGK